MATVYMTSASEYVTDNEPVKFYTEDEMRELFEKQHDIQHSDANYLLWLKLKTDKSVSYCPEFCIIDTDEREPDGYYESVGNILYHMQQNVNDMFKDDYDEEEPDYYNAYWNLQFTDRKGKNFTAKLGWGAIEFETLESALMDIISDM